MVRPDDDPSAAAIVVETDSDLELGRRVVVETLGHEVTCVVVATPSQVLHSRVEDRGRIVAVLPQAAKDDWNAGEILDAHVAAAMPVLSEPVSFDGLKGRVTRLDVPKREVTVEMEDGESLSVAITDLDRYRCR